ncbi:hypothetical protein EOPP23_08480 [Endozoicomonas sp. OPT23]|uniref:LTA synthase family protein n=1 Tax=Endozoicomonas sp. OPT23 TaxID=2072845 RepID=UPI00129A559A|nr:LTA synthase family protein [Endozoicomonas sp. OPT23]MRI33017.1 hypothetical protein [Endozoicomonas sp. OPT23]
MKNSSNKYLLRYDLAFLAGSFLIVMLLSSIARAILLTWNFELAQDIPTADTLNAFIVGMRFDMIICSVIMLPMVLGLLLPSGLRQRKIWMAWLIIMGSVITFTALTEPTFYYEFHSRLSSIAVEYLNEDPTTVVSMIVNGTPAFTLLFAWALSIVIVVWLFKALNKATSPQGKSNLKGWLVRIPVFLLVAVILTVTFRGGTLRSGAPLRWGDAIHSQHIFANHLALNGLYTLTKALERRADKKEANTHWLTAMENQKALDITRQMIVQPQDKLLNSKELALFRETSPEQRKLPENVKNVVIVLMESFTARYTGFTDNSYNITPYFDQLREEGLLFDRAFSNGTHTHQGMFATFACFPNTPGNEYLMQKEEGDTHFSGYPDVMSKLGYTENAYVYNGAFNWDNQEGFFRKQGITNFFGRDQIKNAKFIDPTWGVSDQDMFDQSLIELDKMSDTGKPFFAMLQTLSNHLPYTLPEPLPVEPVKNKDGSVNERLTVMKYSDWALGKFFEQAKEKGWYKDTLFVLLGDHGFGTNNLVTTMDLMRYHVPVLMIAPKIRESVGTTNSKTMSQVDVVPTAISLLGKSFPQHCWGRNTLALPENDPGFAIVKPSGNDPLVAMIEGDKVMIKEPNLKPELFKNLDLGSQPSVTRVEKSADPETYKSMKERMSAYIQTALRSLNNKAVGDKPGLRPIEEDNK